MAGAPVPPRHEARAGNFSGLFSRCISLQHRFVYEMLPGEVERDGACCEGSVKITRMWIRYEGL